MMKKLLLLIPLFIFGCGSLKDRQIRKLDALVLQQPLEFSRLSNLLNPCFSGKAKSDTVIKVHTDTLIQDGSTTTVRIKDTVYVTKTKPGRVITNTRTLSIHDTVENQRKTGVLNNQLVVKSDSLTIVKTQLAATKHGRNIWRMIAIGLISLVVIFTVAKVVIFFYGGGWANTIKKVI